MKKIKFIFLYFLCLNLLLSCSKTDLDSAPVENNSIEDILNDPEVVVENNDTDENDDPNTNESDALRILSLGDSYTIGQSVCATCRFPVQLQDSLINNLNDLEFDVDIIAQTGWTTTNLLNAIDTQVNFTNYNLVTLLIGVNNQYQNTPFTTYEAEFPQLLENAILFANGNKNNVIVVSIPDYAYTPFGNENAQISTEIDIYNAFAENYCSQNDITFVNITDITRNGIMQPDLVASDGLHPSEIAYSLFVERLLPHALEIFTD